MHPVAHSELQDLIVEALVGDPAVVGFEVCYQPIVRLGDNATVAVEALARWSHPAVGHVCPTQFVGMAEALGLIGVVDNFVLDRACADTEGIARACGRAVDVHVNVSAGRLGRPRLELAVDAALDRYGLRPDRLVLEITETAQITDLGAAVAAARRLRDRGVRIALDDFGAGCNWLGRLHHVPVDMVKLDATATHMEAGSERIEAMCQALVGLCGRMGLTIVAEGIETDWQAETLRRLGCDLGQGFLYGPPEQLSRMSAPHPRATMPRTAIAV